MKQTDRARRKTDLMLNDMERRITALYYGDPALLRLRHKYNAYMQSVGERVADIYKQYAAETDRDKKRQLKREYEAAVKRLTVQSKAYKKLMDEITTQISRVNQSALDMINADMPQVYEVGYNAVAELCERVGINVDEQG